MILLILAVRGVMDRAVPRQQRVCRQAPHGADHPGQRLAPGHGHPVRLGRTKYSHLSAQLWRLASRIGQRKAAVLVAHSIIVAIWHILRDGTDEDLSPDYFVRRLDRERTQRRLVRQLEALGLTVTIEPAA